MRKAIFMKKAVVALLTTTIISSSITGCGTKSTGGTDSKSGEKTILVAVPSDFDKISFLNEKGDLDGFEIELLKKIDEKLKDYKFEYEASSFENILIELDAGKIDLGSCEYEWSEERAEKYEFAKEGFRNYDSYLISIKDSGYTSLESLAGKTLGNWGAKDNVALQIEKYNKKNPDKAIKMEDVSELDNKAKIEALKAGRWEALYDNLGYIKDYQDEFGDIFDIGDVIYESEAYYLYPKDGKHKELRDAVDKVLKELKEDGTVNELAMKWIGIKAYED